MSRSAGSTPGHWPVDRDVPQSTHSRRGEKDRRDAHRFGRPCSAAARKDWARGKRRTACCKAWRLAWPLLALARRYQSSQSPWSIEIALRKLARASGTRRAPSWARPRASHGLGDRGIHVFARRASFAAAAQSPLCRATLLRLSAVLPTRPTAANPAATTSAATPIQRVDDESRGDRLERLAAMSREAPQRRPASVTAGRSHAQSAPVW